jgi:hypothetical protein
LPIPSGGASSVQVYSAPNDSGAWSPPGADSVVNLSDAYKGTPKISVTVPHFSYYALLSGASSTVNLTGTWTGPMTVMSTSTCQPTASGTATFVITQTGNATTGTAAFMSPNTINFDGTVTGNMAAFTVHNSCSGTTQDLVFSPCTVSSTSINCTNISGKLCLCDSGTFESATGGNVNLTKSGM